MSLRAAAVPMAMTTKSIIRMLLNIPSQNQGKSRIGAFMHELLPPPLAAPQATTWFVSGIAEREQCPTLFVLGAK